MVISFYVMVYRYKDSNDWRRGVVKKVIKEKVEVYIEDYTESLIK